jgi:type I restriction enzyme S subunit
MRLTDGFQRLATAPDGVARLRELILSLAVKGKLVPQDPNDEPASLLLRQIRAERDLLIGNGKIKRDKPLPVIADDEIPFNLPTGWTWSRLGSLCSFENGDRGPNYPSKTDFVEHGEPFINAGHLVAGEVNFESMNYISPDRFDLLRSGKVRPGDILYCLRGSLGKTALVQEGISGAIASSLVIVRAATGVSRKFAMQYFASPLASQEVSRFDNGTAQPNLGANDLAKFVIPLPPVGEQRRIASKVDELMRLCDELENRGRLEAEHHARLTATLFDALAASESAHALAENWARVAAHFDLLLDRPEAVDALEQTILQLAVRGLLVRQDPSDEPASELLQKIRESKNRLIAERKIKRDTQVTLTADAEKPYDLPVSWEWCSLDEIAAVGTGTTPPRDNRDYYFPPSTRWVTSGETGQPFIEDTLQHVSDLALRETSLRVYPVHTLIVAMYGQGKTRGQISELLVPATTNQACAAIVLINEETYHRQYVKLFFEKIYDEIREQAAGGAQPNLNVGKVKSTLIPIPPLPEQSRIVARVQALRRLCTDLRERLTARQTCQARFAEALVDQAGLTAPVVETNTDDLAAAA